jgi:outer membrane protein assembly factor BamB
VNSGNKLWQRKFRATGRCFCHPLSANAAPTPCSDGESIFAFFSSNDLVCLDLDGNLKWYRGLAVDHPKAGHDTGMSSSPAIHGNTIVCQVENQGDSFVMALDKHSGATIWEIERPRDASWSSPVIFMDAARRALCLLNSPDRVTIVELESGRKVWEKMGRSNPISSPSIVGNEIYLPLDGTTALQLKNNGSFAERWTSSRATAGSSSTIVYKDCFYSIARGGILNCFSVADGERTWQARIGGQFWSTPVVAEDRMYLFAQDGKFTVVALTGTFATDDDRVLYSHTFADEVFLASPAISNGAIFIRSDRYLYKFARDPA